MKHTLDVFIDIPKAFDRVVVEKPLVALQDMRIHGRPMRFLGAYLTGRTFTLNLGAPSAFRAPSTQSFPQGRVLSPLLFNVALSRFHPLPRPRNSACVAATIYADEVRIWTTNKRTATAVLVLQDAVDHLIQKLAEVGLGVGATEYGSLSSDSHVVACFPLF